MFLAAIHTWMSLLVIETVPVGNPGDAGDPIQFQGVFGVASPYGTFDQGGNVLEFNETVPQWDRMPGTTDTVLPAGPQEVRWRADELAPRVDHARLRALGRSEIARLVRVR